MADKEKELKAQKEVADSSLEGVSGGRVACGSSYVGDHKNCGGSVVRMGEWYVCQTCRRRSDKLSDLVDV